MSLILGKNHVSRQALATCPMPEATDRYVPVSHLELANLVADSLVEAGFSIEEEDHVIARDGLRYFGGFAISREDIDGTNRRIVCGLRNSADKAFAASICIGNQMMVCENLHFHSEKSTGRRHTKNIKQDLPRVVAAIISELLAEWTSMEERINIYEDFLLTEKEACALATKLVDQGALPKQKLYGTIQHWRNPELAADQIVDRDSFLDTATDSFNESGYAQALDSKKGELIDSFGGDTLWGLFNAVTQELKGSDVHKLPQRTMILQATFDTIAGYVNPNAPASGGEVEVVNTPETFEVEAEAIDFSVSVD